MTAQLVETSRPSALRPLAAALLVVYGVALAAVAFWPVPVDRGAGPLLRAITRLVPWLTYDVIETAANVLLFLPLGVLLALLLHRNRPLVLPLVLTVTLLIEGGQALLLPARTATVRDVVANAVGGLLGWLVVAAVERRRSAGRSIPSHEA